MAAPEALDPELLRLPKPRLRIGWLLALSVTVLSLSLLHRLWPDLTFWRQGATPSQVTPGQASAAESDRFIQFEGAPERAYMGRMFRSPGSVGVRLAPIQGSNAHLWILIPGSAWHSEVVYSEAYRGRLKAMSDMPFVGALTAWFENLPVVPRPVTIQSVEKALSNRNNQLTSTAGDTLTVLPATAVTVSENVPGQALLTTFATPDHPDEAHWNATLVNRAIIERGQTPERETLSSWTYRITAPDGTRPIVTKLAEAGLLATEVKPLERQHSAKWGDLSVAGKTILIANSEIPWTDVISVSAAVPRQLPGDARVLVIEQEPADYWYVPILFGLFTAFAGLFAWAFVVALRPVPPTSET